MNRYNVEHYGVLSERLLYMKVVEAESEYKAVDKANRELESGAVYIGYAVLIDGEVKA